MNKIHAAVIAFVSSGAIMIFSKSGDAAFLALVLAVSGCIII